MLGLDPFFCFFSSPTATIKKTNPSTVATSYINSQCLCLSVPYHDILGRYWLHKKRRQTNWLPWTATYAPSATTFNPKPITCGHISHHNFQGHSSSVLCQGRSPRRLTDPPLCHLTSKQETIGGQKNALAADQWGLAWPLPDATSWILFDYSLRPDERPTHTPLRLPARERNHKGFL